MRKLLSLINLICFIIVISSCHNVKNSGQNSTTETKLISTDSVHESGAEKVKGKTELTGITGNDKGIKKDSAEFSGKGKAIIPLAPNQNKIDSVKNSKRKK
jgi:hypothetical protein